ncbi:MAG: potassium channel family protein [Gaiellaceae bacterium]
MSKISSVSDERALQLERKFARPVIVAALLVIPVIVIEESSLSSGWRDAAAVVNWLIWLVFAAEILITTWVASNRLRWLGKHVLEIVIVVATVPFYPASLQSARILRLARVLRLLRLAQISRRAFSIEGVRYAALAAALTVLGGGAAYAAVEKHGMSTWDGVWWAITTMTTVGYGGSPSTDMGRLITIMVLAVGIGFVAFFTGAIAERFLRGDLGTVEGELSTIENDEADVLHELREVRQRLERIEARLAARGSP